MAAAKRYESDDEDLNANNFFVDMKKRFHLISSSDEAMDEMNSLESVCGSDVDAMRRKCTALVLANMGFIENGI